MWATQKLSHPALILEMNDIILSNMQIFFEEKITETEKVSKAIVKLQLKQRVNFWVFKLVTLTPQSLNQALTNV